LGYEAILPELRELPFLRKVKGKIVTPAAARAHMAQILDRELGPARAKRLDRAFVSLGLMAPALDLRSLYLDLLQDEVAGFYDPAKQSIYLLRREVPKTDNIVAKLLAPKAFDPDQEKIVTCHELAHALADQHYGLDKLAGAVADDEDAAFALSALAEGDATAVMFDEMMALGGAAGGSVRDMDAEVLAALFKFAKSALPLAGGARLRQAPRIVRDGLLAPYLDGTLFVVRALQEDGWGRMAAVWRNPPQSSEQILHPEKYFGERDEPLDIALPPPPKLGAGWSWLGSGVLGQLGLAALVDVDARNDAVTGWGGDRYGVWENDGGDVAHGLRSDWDTEQDAFAFALALARHLDSSISRPGAPASAPRPTLDSYQAGDTLEGQQTQGRPSVIRMKGRTVVWVAGLEAEVAAKVVAWLLAAPVKTKQLHGR
jgi:hypothetical protein